MSAVVPAGIVSCFERDYVEVWIGCGTAVYEYEAVDLETGRWRPVGCQDDGHRWCNRCAKLSDSGWWYKSQRIWSCVLKLSPFFRTPYIQCMGRPMLDQRLNNKQHNTFQLLGTIWHVCTWIAKHLRIVCFSIAKIQGYTCSRWSPKSAVAIYAIHSALYNSNNRGSALFKVLSSLALCALQSTRYVHCIYGTISSRVPCVHLGRHPTCLTRHYSRPLTFPSLASGGSYPTESRRTQ